MEKRKPKQADPLGENVQLDEAVLASQVPKPIGWGTYVSDPDTHFYLCEFVEMYEDLPGARDWATSVADLHLNSTEKSPTGEFGFHVTTRLANVPVNNTWNPSWESFWRQQMRSLFDHDDHVHGTDHELTALKTAFLHKYWAMNYPGGIPRLRAVLTVLADIGIYRNPRYKLGQPCIREYLKRVLASEPAADSDGRSAVYAMKFHTLLSAMYSKDKRFRQTLRNELEEIIGKMGLSMSDGDDE
ncbi:hypothetical protein CSAL01_05410 [Colletotrichum salicis]|uniref:Uncharacterized protein n=1 Tax=Colletotrichum salicis TaxID=1209931 RepID=A0A135RSS1_9PEZI|nr:hypothetical protein CSAL01_05410 [Colletotrichum salicis]